MNSLVDRRVAPYGVTSPSGVVHYVGSEATTSLFTPTENQLW